MTTADYLTQLQDDKQNLVNNLTAQGIPGLTGDETFTQLVPEVLNIPIPVGSDYFPIDWYTYFEGPMDYSNYTKYSVRGLSFGDIISSNAYETDMEIMHQNIFNFEDYLIYYPDFSWFAENNEDPDYIQKTNVANAFANCYNLVHVGFIDTSSCTDFSFMFSGCEKLVRVENLYTSNGTDFTKMFNDCTNLVYVPPMDLSSVVDIQNLSNMFNGCRNLSNESYDNIFNSLLSANVVGDLYSDLGLELPNDGPWELRPTELQSYQDLMDAGWS